MDHGDGWGSSNQHIKVFVKTGAFLRPLGPHRMELHKGLITVGENGDEVTRKAWRVPATKDKLVSETEWGWSGVNADGGIGRASLWIEE